MPKGDTRTMLALEVLAGNAARAGDLATLGICAEAWERAGWWSFWFYDIVRDAGWQGNDKPYRWTPAGAERMVYQSRRRKNRAKLRHQAEALLAVIPHTPLSEPEWQRAKYPEAPDG